MTPLLGDYLSNLAAELSAHVLINIPAWVQTAWQGDETDAAVSRCLDAGIAAFMRRASADAPAYAELWEIIFPRFFKDEQVAAQIASLLDNQRLNCRALQFMAKSAGYQAEKFPDLDFDAAMQEFEGAFLTQAVREPELQGIIQAGQMLAQTEILTETKAILVSIADLLQQVSLKEITGIQADTITATNVVNGTQINYPLAPTAPTTVYPDHWESHYLNALITHCDRLDLTPLAASEATAETTSISAIFTTLYLSGVTKGEEETVAEALSPTYDQELLNSHENTDKIGIESKRYPITANEALANVPRLVILGQPGGGKSTLVNYVAAQLARQRLGEVEAALPHWPEEKPPLPVRIVLRRFAEWLAQEKRQGDAGDVWKYLAFMLERWGCADSYKGVYDTLVTEGGVIFFDGLDEIREPTARQAIIKGAVTEFATTEKLCRVIVTSRPYAYTEKAKWRLDDTLFPVVSLAPFADEQITAFNRAWYTRVMGPRREWADAQCEQYAAALSQTIMRLPHLHRLAVSPLLLTLIAQVHSQGGTLPANRADLYGQTVDLLLSRWENRIVLDIRPGEDVQEEEVLWLGVSTGHLRDVLAKVAYEAHLRQGKQQTKTDGVAEITRSDLKLALVDRFDSGEKAEQIMTYIQHRAGLLVAQEESIYTFPHRTFQEYLAARHVLNQANWTVLLRDHVRQALDWWREVFLLSAGITEMPQSIMQLLKELLPFAPGTAAKPLTLEVTNWAMLAGQTLLETNFHYHVKLESEPGAFTALYQRVQAWLKAAMVADTVLVAGARAEAGDWLAQLGDDRSGVGVIDRAGVKLPDIVWSAEIPAGNYIIGDNKTNSDDEQPRDVVIDKAYRLARFPITNAQFQCFMDSGDWDDLRWWEEIPTDEQKFGASRFRIVNHPRETVSWYQAVAFCRWLNDKLTDLEPGVEIDLPHEYEWEVAVRWPNQDVQKRIYPWGVEFDATKANTKEGDSIGQTTAVGLYPSGKNEALNLYDMSGNVYEWCGNKYGESEETAVAQNNAIRVVRGGSWFSSQSSARAAYRRGYDPVTRYYSVGFRVVLRRHPTLRPLISVLEGAAVAESRTPAERVF